MKDIFYKTRIPNIKQALKERFPHLDFLKIYNDACLILQNEITSMDDRGNKAVRQHLSCNILPGYSIYQSLLNTGVPSEDAINFVEDEMCKAVSKMASFCRWISNKSFAYPVFKFLFGIGMKYGYPKEGWTKTNIEHNSQCIRFDITSCLYCEELKKRGALSLCRAFCQTDHAAYDPLAPGVVFQRKDTLANNSIKCDFCFSRGK